MATLLTEGISQYYETLGDPKNQSVLMISGLGGVGSSWGSQIKRFSERYHVILPDQRGTGKSTRAQGGYSTEQLARDIASVIQHLGMGPVHVVGASTGGAIAQHMALNHPATVRTLTLSSTFARFDAHTHREFIVRKKMAAEWDRADLFSGYALFLFAPRYMREHSDRVQAWIDRAVGNPNSSADQEIALKRIDMIAAHDTFDRLGNINVPTLVVCGDHNACTPLPLSEELAQGIQGAELVVFPEGGELIELEQDEKYFTVVSSFLDRHL
jgi:pimeloyl-ACP methyl ester carboxylesterase